MCFARRFSIIFRFLPEIDSNTTVHNEIQVQQKEMHLGSHILHLKKSRQFDIENGVLVFLSETIGSIFKRFIILNNFHVMGTRVGIIWSEIVAAWR